MLKTQTISKPLFLVLTLTFFTCGLNPPTIAANPKDELDELLTEYKYIKREKARLANAIPKLAVIKKQLESEQFNFNKEIEPFKRELALRQQEADEFDSQVANYNASCAGRPLAPAEKVKCDQTKSRLLAWKSKLESYLAVLAPQGKAFEQRETALDRRFADFEHQRQTLADQKTAVDERHLKWKLKIVKFNESETFKRLKKHAALSDYCSKLPNMGKFEKDIEGSSEIAAGCLKYLWDHQRPRPLQLPPVEPMEVPVPPRPNMTEVNRPGFLGGSFS